MKRILNTTLMMLSVGFFLIGPSCLHAQEVPHPQPAPPPFPVMRLSQQLPPMEDPATQLLRIGERPGAAKNVVLVTYGFQGSDTRTTQIVYRRDKNTSIVLAIVSQKKTPDGKMINHVVFNSNSGTQVDTLSIAEVLTREWQAVQRDQAEAEQPHFWKDFLLTTGDDTLDLLFFTWRALKNLDRTIDEYDSVIDEALQLRDEIAADVTDEEDQLVLNLVNMIIEDAISSRNHSIAKASGVTAAWLGLDIVTWLPGKVLKPLAAGWAKLAAKIGTSKFGRVSAVLGEKFALKSKGTWKYVTHPFTRLGVKLGLSGMRAWVVFKLTATREILGSVKMFQVLGKAFTEAGARSPVCQGIRKIFTTVAEHCGGLVGEKRRLWVLSMIYGLPIGFTAQALARGGNFFQEFDRALHDVGIAFVNQYILGRCAAKFDMVSEQTIFQRWKERQLLNHVGNYMDSAMTYLKVANDANGLTEEDIDELRRRYVANFAYTLTRGPLIGAVSSMNYGELNQAYMAAQAAGQTKKAREIAATEFVTRYGLSVGSWGAYVAYRDPFAREEATRKEHQNHQAGILDLQQVIKWLREHPGQKPPAFVPTP